MANQTWTEANSKLQYVITHLADPTLAVWNQQKPAYVCYVMNYVSDTAYKTTDKNTVTNCMLQSNWAMHIVCTAHYY
jgi:hypothetical protein